MIKDFLTEKLENFQEEFDNLDTRDKLKFIADILPYGLLITPLLNLTTK